MGNFVRIILSYLVRWKCPLCGRTFTLYPPFAVPYKRYVLNDILSRSFSYVNDDRQTYRDGVTEDGMRIGYQASGGDIDERMLEPSTLWRWVGWTGGMTVLLREAVRLICEKVPSSSVFRKDLPVSPLKYRTTERKSLLERVKKIITVAREFARTFGESIFPRFATACCWK